MALKTLEWTGNCLRIIDQTLLPTQLDYCAITTTEEMYDAIKILKVRGAPAIGVSAAFGLYLGIRDFPETGLVTDFISLLQKKTDYLKSSRPTAINLAWALDRMAVCAQKNSAIKTIDAIKAALLEEALCILEEDRAASKAIGENGYAIIKNHSSILTHCNAGGLATVEYGTALAPIYVGKERGKLFHVFVDETRPLLQGARLTAFELKEAGIPLTLICDNMAASVMARGKVDAVIVGADRIAANGDTANKIGTYSVALAAHAHQIPFYVAAPLSTFDVTIDSGARIPIEERDADEIINGFGRQTGPSGVTVFNPAFDVTPNELITAIITEKKVLYPPYKESIKAVVS